MASNKLRVFVSRKLYKINKKNSIFTCVYIKHTFYDLLPVLRLSCFSSAHSYFSVDLILLSTCALLARKIWNYVMYKIFLWNCAVGIKAICATQDSTCFFSSVHWACISWKTLCPSTAWEGMVKNSENFNSSEWHWNFFKVCNVFGPYLTCLKLANS